VPFAAHLLLGQYVFGKSAKIGDEAIVVAQVRELAGVQFDDIGGQGERSSCCTLSRQRRPWRSR
jgi:hypothetical protein